MGYTAEIVEDGIRLIESRMYYCGQKRKAKKASMVQREAITNGILSLKIPIIGGVAHLRPPSKVLKFKVAERMFLVGLRRTAARYSLTSKRSLASGAPSKIRALGEWQRQWHIICCPIL